jgi:hypothetical protein
VSLLWIIEVERASQWRVRTMSWAEYDYEYWMLRNPFCPSSKDEDVCIAVWWGLKLCSDFGIIQGIKLKEQRAEKTITDY